MIASTESTAPWWQSHRNILIARTQQTSPQYVYHLPTITKQAQRLLQCKNFNKLFFAIKANPHPEILRLLADHNFNFECVSLGEITHVQQTLPQLAANRILFTPNFAPRDEYAAALQLGCTLTLDSLYPLHAWPTLFNDRDIIIRLDLGTGYGHHKYVCTAGNEAKFGIPLDQLPLLLKYLQQQRITVVGLHSHSGSGILTATHWQQRAEQLCHYRHHFPQLKYLNLGGGLGINESPEQQPLDLHEVDSALTNVKAANSDLEFWLEPGRYLVAESGVLLTRVTQLKQKGNVRFIGVDTGMNSLIRPALYGSYHPIVNLSQWTKPIAWLCNIVGPICESGDTLGVDRQMPVTYEDDVLLIANAGAYGAVMSSHYNHRAPAPEFCLTSAI